MWQYFTKLYWLICMYGMVPGFFTMVPLFHL